MSTVQAEIRQFVVDNFLFGQNAETFSDEESFLESGVLDSTGVLQLVTFIEQRFDIAIADHELVPDNLDSIARAAAFVAGKQRVNA
jgi:acyl carrier protein